MCVFSSLERKIFKVKRSTIIDRAKSRDFPTSIILFHARWLRLFSNVWKSSWLNQTNDLICTWFKERMDLLSISATKYLYFIGGIMTTELFRRLWKQWIIFYDPDRRREVRDVILFPDKAVACKDFFENFEKCPKIQCSFSHEITGLR